MSPYLPPTPNFGSFSAAADFFAFALAASALLHAEGFDGNSVMEGS